MNKAYIAAPIFNKAQLRIVSTITMMLKNQEWEIFSPYEASRNVWKGRAPKDCSQEERDSVLQGNIDNLDWAELLLAWVGGTEEGRTDTGVVWEMGHFHALKKFVPIEGPRHIPDPMALTRFTLAYIDPTDRKQNMNLMLEGTVDAVTHGPAQLHKACGMLRKGTDGYEYVREIFHPSKHLMPEAKPIS